MAIELALRFCMSILDEIGGRPAGWLGPSRDEVVALGEHGIAQKLLFDIATSGSPRQLAARVVHAAANQLWQLRRAR